MIVYDFLPKKVKNYHFEKMPYFQRLISQSFADGDKI